MKFLGNDHMYREKHGWTDEAFVIGASHCREIDVILRLIVVVRLRYKIKLDTTHFLFRCDWSVYVTILWRRGMTFPTHMTRTVLSDSASWYCTMLHIHSYNLCSISQADICTVPLNHRDYFINASYLIFITGSKFACFSCYWKIHTVPNLVSHFHPTHEISSLEALPSLINYLKILYINKSKFHLQISWKQSKFR
jgi:hypothetical protein